jgi:Raf kinase inhibitor-like YbhB/YbcL family protein
MTIGESLKRVVGKALRPVRAGDDDLAIERLGARSLPKIEVHSASFGDDHVIPARFTHSDGDDVSPALRWHGVPESAAEIVVLCEDPDAPSSKPFVHWIAYGIAPVDGGLIEGVRAEPRADSGMMQGKNSMHADGYAGPAPPPGHGVHHYHFQIFALGRRLDLEPGANRDDIVEAMRGHVIAAGEVVGTYER